MSQRFIPLKKVDIYLYTYTLKLNFVEIIFFHMEEKKSLSAKKIKKQEGVESFIFLLIYRKI